MAISRTVIRNGIGTLAVLAIVVTVIAFWPGRIIRSTAGTGTWTCSMHPQIRMDHFDRCPICGMDLVLVKASSGSASDPAQRADQLQLSAYARQMARVATTRIEMRPLQREIRTVGKVEFDETRMAQIASRVDGRVEQVYADFTGTLVKQQDHLVKLYSPELVATQEEFLVATRREQELKASTGSALSLAASARRRLQLWGVTDDQISEILKTGQPETHIVIHAPIGGTVVEKMVRAGQYVKQGEVLYTIADLDHVWLIVEVYETDLPWVRFGQSVQVTLEGDPAASFVGQVGFIEPILNEQTRTVRIRVIIRNEDRKLRPGMFAQAVIRVPIMPDGTPAPTGLEGKFSCPMHPYVVSDTQVPCRVCEMSLEKIPGTPIDTDEPPLVLAVPAEAVLTTGVRQLVYVAREKGLYELREPHLGPRAGDYYPVLHGLAEGDEVVNRGNFLLDSQFQISGKPSLLYPEGMAGGGHAGHDHGGGEVPASEEPASLTSSSSTAAEQNLGKLPPPDREAARQQADCPVTGKPLGSMGVPIRVDVDGRPIFLCCAGCTAMVQKDPQAILQKLALPKSSVPHDGHKD